MQRPELAEAGVMLQVPVCGLSLPDGEDLLAYDENGKLLPLLSLGRSANNSALAVVQPGTGAKRLAVYFGSKMRPIQNRAAFKPGPTVTLYPWNGPPPMTWPEVEKRLERAEPLAVLPMDKISLSYNPLDNRDAFVMDFHGYLRVRTAGPQTLMLVSDDAGFLFVRQSLLLERGGNQGAWAAARGECRKQVTLPEGELPIRCVVVDGGGDQMAVVGRWKDAKTKATLEPADFVQSGNARLTGVATRNRDGACPAFTCQAQSYIGFQGAQFTEVELMACNGKSTEWNFADGSHLQGATVRKIFVGLDNLPVTAKQGAVEARGLVQFPENPPQSVNIHHSKPFSRYSQLITQESPERLAATVLKGYRNFLGYQELNPDLAAVDAALVQKPGLDADDLYSIRLELARTSSGRDPAKAVTVYEALMKMRLPLRDWEPLAREYAEFQLLRCGNPVVAEEVVGRFANTEHDLAALDALNLRFQIAAVRGDVAAAEKLWPELLRKGAAYRDRLGLTPVKRNEIDARVDDLVRSGFPLEARRQLQQWERGWPEDWRSGRLSLARANCWRAWGWHRGAVAELDAAEKLNPILPNLPEVEMLKAELLYDLGENKKGRDLLEKIAKDYPNHPVAAKARDRMGNR